MVEICGDQFRFEKIPLKAVRPFVMDHVVLNEIRDLVLSDRVAVQEFVTDKVGSGH